MTIKTTTMSNTGVGKTHDRCRETKVEKSSEINKFLKTQLLLLHWTQSQKIPHCDKAKLVDQNLKKKNEKSSRWGGGPVEGPGCTSMRMILDPQHMGKKPGVPATPGKGWRQEGCCGLQFASLPNTLQVQRDPVKWIRQRVIEEYPAVSSGCYM